MSQIKIKQLIENQLSEDGMVETGIAGVKLFRVTHSVRCAPAIYEPAIIAIVSGGKEAILDGQHYHYDHQHYLCCSLSMPVEAGSPHASEHNPLLGVYISLDTQVMTELTIAMERHQCVLTSPQPSQLPPGFTLSSWDDNFSDGLLRLLQLIDNDSDRAILAESRLRELYYAVLKGQAGPSARRAFGVGNDIARAIEHLTNNIDQPINIETLASQVGMSRAVLHRKFKQATSMSPIQFVKAMRLNSAAMKIAAGTNVSVAAMEVGYVSASQFSREFKRLYGQSPKQWLHAINIPNSLNPALYH